MEISGRSLIQRAIESALAILPTNQIYVSTDSSAIMKIASSYEINIHSRENYAASDNAVASDVVRDFFTANLFSGDVNKATSVIYLQPTSPFRNPSQIQDCILLHEKFNRKPIVSVKETPFLLQKFLKRGIDGLLHSYTSEDLATGNAQGLNEFVYLPNGAIYIFQIQDFIDRKTFPINASIEYVMDDLTSIDIDKPSDLKIAEAVSKSLQW